MKRRQLLKLAPVALAAGAVPAFAVAEETPVMRAYRAWEAENARVNAAGDVDDDTFERMVNDRWEVEKRLAQVPAENVKDVILKIVAWTRFGECDLEADHPLLETLWAEARALIGGAA